MSVAQLAAVLLVLAACIPDLKSGRIPNTLTFGAAAAGLLYHGVTGGVAGAGTSLLGWWVGALLFMPIFALKGMGAGDVKLLAALGAWLGAATVVWIAALSAIAGGVLAVVVALFHGYLAATITNIKALLIHWQLFGIRPLEAVTLAGGRGLRLAYAVPIAAGTLVTLWLR